MEIVYSKTIRMGNERNILIEVRKTGEEDRDYLITIDEPDKATTIVAWYYYRGTAIEEAVRIGRMKPEDVIALVGVERNSMRNVRDMKDEQA